MIHEGYFPSEKVKLHPRKTGCRILMNALQKLQTAENFSERNSHDSKKYGIGYQLIFATKTLAIQSAEINHID